jgi:osmotically-inducible protein OsmY
MSVVPRQREMFASPPTNQQAAVGSHSPRTDLPVFCPDGYVGKVVELAPAWLDQPTHLLVRSGAIVPQTVSIPIAWVDDVEADRVRLRVRRRRVARLPPLRTDEVIAADVRQAIATSGAFSDPAALDAITIVCEAGRVSARGNVRTVWRALYVEVLARQVRGVVDVSNQLVGDDELEDQIAWAIKRERQLAIDGLHVAAEFGSIRLGGRVESAEACARAFRLARQVRGAREVVNAIEVVPRPHRPPTFPIDPHAMFAAQRRSQRSSPTFLHNHQGARHVPADPCV